MQMESKDCVRWHTEKVCVGGCWTLFEYIETVSPEGTFCDTVQVPFGAGDMQLI